MTTPPGRDAEAQRRRGARRFILDNGIVLVAQVLQRLRGLVTLPLIVRGLGTESYGVWAQFVAFTMLAGGLLGLNLHLPLVRAIAADPRRAAVVHTTVLISSIVIGAVLSLALFGLLPDVVVESMLGTADRRFLVAGLVFVVFTNVRTIALNVYRATDRIAMRSLVELGASAFDVLGVLVLLGAGHGLDLVVTWMAGTSVIVGALASAHALSITGLARPTALVLAESLRYSLPLVPGVLAQWVLDRSDRVLLAVLAGGTAVGAYSAHYAVASLILFVQTPLQVTLVPKAASLWASDRAAALRYLTSSFRIVVTMVVPFVALLPLVAPDLFQAIANDEVAAQSRLSTLLVGLGVGSWGLAVVVSLVFYVDGRTSRIALVTFCCAVVNVGLNLLLIPRMGLLGAGTATAVAYGAGLVAYLRLARSSGFRVDFGHAGRCVAAASVMALVVGLLRLWWTGPVIAAAIGAVVYVGGLLISGAIRNDLALLRATFRR